MKKNERRYGYLLYSDTRKLLKFTLTIQLAILGLIALDKFGLNIPILRQAIGFVYLTFIPGILILRTLRLHELGVIETILYSTGLSLSFLMFTGALINTLLPIIGVSKPISEIPLIITISIVVLLLCFICYLRDRDYSTHFLINTQLIFSPLVLSLLLLPFLAIFGAYFFNYYNNNFLLLFLLAIISIMPVLVVTDKIPKEIYPLLIWLISISLLFHSTLLNPVKMYENTLCGVITSKGYWDPTVAADQNSLLAVIMILPVYSIICGTSILSAYNVFYPLLYSITPLVAYVVFKTQTNDKIAFLSSFFLMSTFPFYVIIPRNVRTGFAMFFLSLLALLLVNGKLERVKVKLLSIIFAFSLIVSHYGTSYIYMFSLPLVLLIIQLPKVMNSELNIHNRKLCSPAFTCLYITFSITWYMYTANVYNFEHFIRFFAIHIPNALKDFINPRSSYLAYGLARGYSYSIDILKYLYLLSAFLIGIGLVSVLYKRFYGKKRLLNDEFLCFSVAFSIEYLVMSLVAGSFGTLRVIIIMLIFLAPFIIIGLHSCTDLFKWVKRQCHDMNSNMHSLLCFVSLFLVVFLLLNSGFISETIIKGKDYSPSVLISKERLSKVNIECAEDAMMKDYLYGFYTPIYDVKAVEWMINKSNKEYGIFVDLIGWEGRFRMIPEFRTVKKGVFTTIQPILILEEDTEFTKGSYIVMFYHNTNEGIIIETRTPFKYFSVSTIQGRLGKSNKIYTNGGGEIYYP